MYRTDLTQLIDDSGDEMYALIEELYPICRSITGNGVRETLKIIKKHLSVEIHEIASGTKAFDWEVPLEWNIRGGTIKNLQGNTLIDFKENNLHVLNYSSPIKARVTNEELKKHLFSIPKHPDWVPYRTSYYEEKWGFCVSHNQLQTLNDAEYYVEIDSDLSNGSLTYGEFYKQGRLDKEILISCHICHPSLCNDNLSGIALSTFLAKKLMCVETRFS